MLARCLQAQPQTALSYLEWRQSNENYFTFIDGDVHISTPRGRLNNKEQHRDNVNATIRRWCTTHCHTGIQQKFIVTSMSGCTTMQGNRNSDRKLLNSAGNAPKLICNLKRSSKMCLQNAGNHQCPISSGSSLLLMDTQFWQTCLFSATLRISCNLQRLSYYLFSHQIPYGDKTVRNGSN